jgi:uncharacterized membrane protein HdeD (DUF308 family)
MYAPFCFFNFYIWHIRGQVGWLVFAIIGVLGFIATFVASFKKPVEGANQPSA